MPGILHREHGLGVRMLIPPTLILVQLSSANGPHPRTTMLLPHQRKYAHQNHDTRRGGSRHQVERATQEGSLISKDNVGKKIAPTRGCYLSMQ